MQDSDGNRTDYLYDPVGRLTGIWAPNYDYVSFSYDAGGRLIEKWFPNGVDSQYGWNADNTLASLTNKMGATVVSSHVYTYDALANRATDTEKVGATTIPYVYGYDALNRLVQVQNGTAATQENYAYDPLGNRTTKTVNATTPVVTAYVYDAANQLKEIHQTNAAGPLLASLAYDFNGNLVTKTEGATVTSLTYDALNRMIQAAKTGQSTQTYAYDDSGRRVQKSIGGTATNFLYGGPDIVAEYASTWGTPTAQYTHGPNTDDPIIRATATSAQYFHQDGLGSIMAVTNNLGGTDATQRFDAWGNKVASTGTAPRYGYTGREPDETGLEYYRARYYDPAIGRFTQRDPIGLAGGVNQYAYVNGNPVNLTDPTGLIAAASSAGFGGYGGGGGKGAPDTSNASAYPAPDTSMIVACAPLCTGLGVLPPPPVGGYQGLQQEKPTNDGYQQLFGTQTGAPPSLIGGAWQGLKDAISNPGEFANWLSGGLIFNEAKTPQEVLAPAGQPIGQPGTTPGIRVLPGGTQGGQDLFDQLSKGGTVTNNPSYPGTQVKLPNDGGTIGIRPKSGSGDTAIDVNVPGLKGIGDKIHFPQ